MGLRNNTKEKKKEMNWPQRSQEQERSIIQIINIPEENRIEKEAFQDIRKLKEGEKWKT